MKWKRRSASDAPVFSETPQPRTPVLRPALATIKARFTRKPVTPLALNRWELWIVTGIAIVAVLTVAGIAGVISYSHMKDWALANGEPSWRAHLFPLSVDGAILAASLVIYTDSRAHRTPDWLAYAIVATGMAWSIGANVGHTWTGEWAARLIAGWPPAAMAVSVELLMRFVRRWRGQADQQARREERGKVRPVPAPRPAEPESKTSLHVVRPERPGWLPEHVTKAKDAITAYLDAHPGAQAPEVQEALSAHFQFDASYARRMVRQHQLKAAGEG